eukprot:7222169-Alexandrium_andersonii.AAC.1
MRSNTCVAALRRVSCASFGGPPPAGPRAAPSTTEMRLRAPRPLVGGGVRRSGSHPGGAAT